MPCGAGLEDSGSTGDKPQETKQSQLAEKDDQALAQTVELSGEPTETSDKWGLSLAQLFEPVS